MKKTLIQKRREFLDDTIKYYSEDVKRRAVVYESLGMGMCQYLTSDGRRCALGRHIPKKEFKLLKNGDLDLYSISLLIEEEILPKKIADLGEGFLAWVQGLHDNDNNWDENGFTEKGREEIEENWPIYEKE